MGLDQMTLKESIPMLMPPFGRILRSSHQINRRTGNQSRRSTRTSNLHMHNARPTSRRRSKNSNHQQERQRQPMTMTMTSRSLVSSRIHRWFKAVILPIHANILIDDLKPAYFMFASRLFGWSALPTTLKIPHFEDYSFLETSSSRYKERIPSH